MAEDRLLEGVDIFVFVVPTDGVNVDAKSTGNNAFPLFPAKVVRTGCPDTPSKAQVRWFKPISKVSLF